MRVSAQFRKKQLALARFDLLDEVGHHLLLVEALGLVGLALQEGVGKQTVGLTQEVLQDYQVVQVARELVIHILVVVVVQTLSRNAHLLVSIRKTLDVFAVGIVPTADEVQVGGHDSLAELSICVLSLSEDVDVFPCVFNFVDQPFRLDESRQLVGHLFKCLKVQQLEQLLVKALFDQEVGVDQEGGVGLVPFVFVHHFVLQLLVVEVTGHAQDFLYCNVSS